MSKEYASLLAQVIPVFALAIGLEMRSLTERAAKNFADLRASGATLQQANFRWFALFGALAVTQGFLAAIEIKTLNVVANSPTFWFDLTVPLAIVIVILIPIVSGFYSLIIALNEVDRSGAVRFSIGVIVVLLALGVVEYFTFG